MCRRASLPVRRGRGWRQAAPGRQFRLWARRISKPISPKAHASTTRRSRSAAFDCMNTPATEPVTGVINAGSSSVKFSFYEGERQILTGQVDGIGAHPSASATGPNGEKLDPPDLGKKPPTVPSEVLPAILPWAREKLGERRLDAPCRPWRSAPLPARPRHARTAGQAGSAGAVRAIAR